MFSLPTEQCNTASNTTVVIDQILSFEPDTGVECDACNCKADVPFTTWSNGHMKQRNSSVNALRERRRGDRLAKRLSSDSRVAVIRFPGIRTPGQSVAASLWRAGSVRKCAGSNSHLCFIPLRNIRLSPSLYLFIKESFSSA